MTTTQHKIRWYVYAGGEKHLHQKTMRGYRAWDAECSCGWRSGTGGGLKSAVQEDVQIHKWMAEKGLE
jgi:hypothetical protein